MRSSKINLILALIILAGTSVGAAKTVTWTGCGITKKAFMSEIAKAYEAKTGVKVELSGGGATKGIRSASAGASDLGGTCRHWLLVDDSNPEKLNCHGSKHPQEKDAQLVHVAWDAIVVITHPDNPVKNISLADLKKVYEGKITNWKDLGGPDKTIALITREGKNNGVGHMFRQLVFNDANYEFKARSLRVKSSGPLEQKIEKTVTALGVTGISSAKKRQVTSMSLDGVAPGKENIASGKYSLIRPLYITVAPNASEEVRKVLDFILSEEGQKIVSEQGTVNLAEGKPLQAVWAKKAEEMGLNRKKLAYNIGAK